MRFFGGPLLAVLALCAGLVPAAHAEGLTQQDAKEQYRTVLTEYFNRSGIKIPSDRMQKMIDRQVGTMDQKVFQPYFQDGQRRMSPADFGNIKDAAMVQVELQMMRFSGQAPSETQMREAMAKAYERIQSEIQPMLAANQDPNTQTLGQIAMEAFSKPWGGRREEQGQGTGAGSGGFAGPPAEEDCSKAKPFSGCYFRKAMDNISKGSTREALSDLDAELEQNPNNVDALRARGRINADLGRNEAAAADAQRALELNPGDQAAYSIYQLTAGRGDTAPGGSSGAFQMGSGGYASGGYGGSSGSSGQRFSSLQLTGRDPAAAKSLRDAQGALAMGETKKALPYIQRAMAADPSNPEPFRMLANIYRRQGDYAGLRRAAEAGLRRFPNDMVLLNSLALANNKLKNYQGAIAAANKVLEQNPKDADALANLAYAYGGLGDRAKMLEYLQKAAAANPLYKKSLESAQNMPPGSETPFFFPWEAGDSAQPHGPGGAGSAAPKKGWSPFSIAMGMGALLLALGILGSVAGPVLTRVRTVFTRAGSGPAVAEGPSLPLPGASDETLLRGQYKILRQIGAGGMGTVYEGSDVTLSRPVAIKKMREEMRLDRRERLRFINEAKTVAALHHPNIVDIYAIIEEGGEIYLAFEFVSGKTIHEIIYSRGALGFPETLSVCRSMVAALEFAHGHGVIHRDLKPSNVMISKEGFVKVMDFGIARVAKDALSVVAKTNTVVGTPPYMAPEQEQGVVRKESDIYSLAICVYEMLCGRLPFVGSGAGMLMNKVNMSYVPVSKMAAGLPPGADEVFARAFQSDPDKRFHSAREFLAALEALPAVPRA